MLVKGILPFISECSTRGISVNMLTRRMLPISQLEFLLNQNNVCYEIGIDTLLPKTASKIGCPLVTDEYLKLLGTFVSRKGRNILVRIVVTRFNINEIVEIVDYAYSSGIRTIHFIIPEHFNKKFIQEKVSLNITETTNLGQYFGDLIRKGLHVTINYPHAAPAKKRPNIVCMAKHGSLTLLPDGRLSICQHLPALIVGSLHDKDIIDTDLLNKYISPPRSSFVDTPCYHCEYFSLCNSTGRCYYSAYQKGRLFGPDAYCTKLSAKDKQNCQHFLESRLTE